MALANGVPFGYDRQQINRRGRQMRLLIALFVLAVLAAASAGFGITVWDGGTGRNDGALRVIHYDTNYDLSARRREPVR
jgi:hypothetical protein